ncbi:alpha-lytic protease prodomain-containing protein [Streptomyces sp. NBC_01221]|uniref:alpha-lytic protease prodomain-containing protein n=1 Tax=unclassified Streptomyces TaxID=2593676 RepID=UPI002253B0EA|nr:MULTISPECIES: alpha-lytic protease prodomain-containing protein [unclassified Streptomyces]WSP55887.1 alpha-lytic protease prodomain-containing protein [Streptomyces sp. NBC_01241]WSU23377.1 alpha-lytic protease prodomain-containing protein [Streptomyces sp. NBC_01108]MCX4787602.1 alpha-lytic protease prodomain-containing protein [Streptomyces sp. NBC_01221]MCX4796613.1 alpha-lytic protease prodomain-containing protein [Streptomyces sp. NBC_01242]WSJ37847.1 alpha-lytic protease prodomain-co
MEPFLLRRRALAACTATVAVGVLALAGLTGSASADPAPRPTGPTAVSTDQLSPGLLKAMRRDLGLTAAEARGGIGHESRAAAVAAGLKRALGADFAGARVSGDDAALTVATTDAADATRIGRAGAKAVVVAHSRAELDTAKAALDRVALRKAPEGIPAWYVDVATNRVVVQAARASAADAFLAAADVPHALVTVRESREEPRTFTDLRGGDAYYMNGLGRCSIGFPVKRGSSQSGFVSAGHCGTPGVGTSGYDQQAQGSFQGSVFPGRDYSWVATNTNWTPRALVNGYGNGDVPVTGSTEALEGSSVCRSGSTTGWHCGTVQQRNTSVTYQEGTVSGVTRTNVCAEPGDSGGSFISGSQAQGITSGGSGNCTQGGTTYFQPVNPALQAYGLTLVTNGTPTDPPTDPTDPPTDPGGGWAAGTFCNAGDRVTYGGVAYRCLQAHSAMAGWEPPNVPALWERG